MFYRQVSLISVTTLVVTITLSQIAIAQTQTNSGINKISTVESLHRQNTQRGNAEILGTIELGTETQRSPRLTKPPATRAIQIKPLQRDLFTPRPVTPTEADATIDRGVRVIIDNP